MGKTVATLPVTGDDDDDDDSDVIMIIMYRVG